MLCLALSEDDRCLVAGKAGGTVVLADVVSGEIVNSKQAHEPAHVTALAVAKLDDNRFAIADKNTPMVICKFSLVSE